MSELRYDPYDYEIDKQAQEVWKRLRDEAPVYRNDEHDFYALSRYDDVLDGLLDQDTYISSHGITLEMMQDEPIDMPMMIVRDPPEHTRMRKLVQRAFTPAAIGQLRPRIEAICATYLDPYVGTDGFDYVDKFAALLPPTVILALLGFPEGFENELRDRMDQSLHIDETPPDGRDLVDASGNFGGGLFALLPELVEQKRANPTDDVLSVLVNTDLAQADGSSRPITTEELNGYVMLIAGAGAETVARLLGWAAVLLARHPDQRELLRNDPALIPNGVEELLRYEAPSPVQGRTASRDVELHGTVIPKGSTVLMLNGSAGRDERHFADADRFDVTRNIDRHLALGFGTHFCIGSALARLEGQIALEQTFKRFPDWNIDESHLEWVHTSSVRGYAKVPLTF